MMLEVKKTITLENKSGKIKLSTEEIESFLRSMISTGQIKIERENKNGIYKKEKNPTLSSGPHNVYLSFLRGE